MPLPWVVVAGVLLVVLGCSGIVWWRVRRRRAEEEEWNTPDQLTALFTVLGHKLEERSFGFLVDRLDRHARILRKLVDSRSRKLAASHNGVSSKLRKDLSRLHGELDKLRQSVSSAEKTFQSRSRGDGNAIDRAATKLAELEGSVADLSDRFERMQSAAETTPERIAGELEKSNSISGRAASEIAELREAWESHVQAMRHELGRISGLMERVTTNGDGSSESPEALRGELEQALARERALKEALEEERSGVRQEVSRVGETIERHGKLVSTLENSCRALLKREETRKREIERLRKENDSLRTRIEEAGKTEGKGQSPATADVEAIQSKFEEAAARLRNVREELELERTTSSELRKRSTGLSRKIKSLYCFHRAIAEGNLPIPTIAVDENLKVFVWNPAAEEFFRLPRSDVLGHRLSDVDIGSADLARALLETIDGAMKSRLLTSRPERGYILHDGEEVRPGLSCEPILAEKERVVGAILAIERGATNGGSRLEASRDRSAS